MRPRETRTRSTKRAAGRSRSEGAVRVPPAATTPPGMADRPAEQAPAGSSPRDLAQAVDYSRDVFERAVLFWDTLRQRADDMIAHERAGKPPLLDFDYETLLDARRFERSLPHGAAVHVEPRRQLPHGHTIGVPGDQLGSIGDAQTGLRLTRILTHRTALIGDLSTPSARPTSPRTP